MTDPKFTTRAALRQPAPDAGDLQGLVEQVEAWLDGGCSSLGVPATAIHKIAAAIQSLTAQLAETERARKSILTTAAAVAWDLEAERAKLLELQELTAEMSEELIAERAKVAELVEGLGPFANAAKRIDYYDGENFNGSLYASPTMECLTELLDGIEGEPLTVRNLRKARALLERMK